jgi:octaprenyl-diphosphate synthase
MTTLQPTHPAQTNGHARPSPPFAPVAADLEVTDRLLASALAGYKPPVGRLVAHLRHYRGKRLRPALMLLAAKACGRVTPAHHTLGAVVEMIHTATLVHDDVLDEADTRRHVATVNHEWGNKAAILFGDMLFTHAFHLTSTVDVRACQLIGEATNRVCAGELQQVSERGNLHLTEADYFQIIAGKTAALTEVAGRIGAIYAGAGEEVAEQLASYGRNLGLAFQIADDLLDLVGTEQKAGKTLGTDIEQQKLTLPLIHALATLPPAAAEALRDRLRTGTAADRDDIAATLAETGSLDYARRRADEFTRNARSALACLPAGECRTILEHLTDWSARREK